MHFSGSLDYKVCAKFAQVVDNTINYSTQIHFAFYNYNQGQKAECNTSSKGAFFIDALKTFLNAEEPIEIEV